MYLEPLAEWANWVCRLAINHLWQATLFFVIALASSFLLRRSPARARYLLWLTASIKFAIPSAAIIVVLGAAGLSLQSVFDSAPTSTTTLKYFTPVVSPLMIPESFKTDATPVASTSTEHNAKATDSVGRSLTFPGLLIWLCGVVTFSANWLRRRRALAGAVKAGRQLNAGREWDALNEVRSWLKISRSISLVITSDVKQPGVWGVARPVVLVPQGISDHLSDDELRVLMMHELAHVMRWDNLVSNVHMSLCCIFWFNPIVWLIDNWLLKEREEACDEMVVSLSGSGETYASSIKKIYRFCLASRVSGLSTAGGSKLKHRLDKILSDEGASRFGWRHKTLLVTTILVSVIITVLAGMPPVQKAVAQSNLALTQPMFNFATGTPPTATTKGCVEDSKQCPRPSTIPVSAETTLARVTVRQDGTVPLQTAASDIANVPDKPSTKVPEQPAIKAAEPPPTFQSAHAVDLKRFSGRYAVDPSVMENFVLDISNDDGELWFKPSHSSKHRLIAQSTVDYVDSQSSNTRITFNLDSTGTVESLTLRGWGPTIVAPRMVLPAPSREGNIQFTLSDFPDAHIVAVAGTFNGWNQSQYLFERVGGQWVCRINLPIGKYQYKFIVDGIWLVDPNNPVVVQDRRGIDNSQLIVH